MYCNRYNDWGFLVYCRGIIEYKLGGIENMYPYFHIILPSYSLLAFIGGFFSLIFIYYQNVFPPDYERSLRSHEHL